MTVSFRAVEVLYHICVNTYETEYREGSSATRQIASSNVPVDRPDNQPVYNSDCKFPLFISRESYCRLANKSLTATTYLQDIDDSANPARSYYSISRYNGYLLSSHVDLLTKSALIADTTKPKKWKIFHLGKGMDMIRHVLWNTTDGLTTDKRYEWIPYPRQKQDERLRNYFGNVATGMSNS